MKIALLATAATAATLLAAPAFAQPANTAPTNYIAGNVGLSFASKADANVNFGGSVYDADADLKNGLFLSAAAGHDFGNGLAVEVEGIYTHNKADDDVNAAFENDVSTRTWGGLVNAKYAFNTGWHNVSPFVGAGVGYGGTRIKIDNVGHDDDGGFMWQAKAGLAFPVNDRTTFDLTYRYLDLPNYGKSAGNFDADYGRLEIKPHLNVVSAGVRVNF